MPLQNSYDLYNLTLTSDQPLVTCIINDIYNILATSVVNSTIGSSGSMGTAGSSGTFVTPNSFDYNLMTVLTGVTMAQSDAPQRNPRLVAALLSENQKSKSASEAPARRNGP